MEVIIDESHRNVNKKLKFYLRNKIKKILVLNKIY